MRSVIQRTIFTLFIFFICYSQQYVNADLDEDVAILKEAIIGLQSEISELKKVSNKNNNVPTGFIYVQFPNEKSPTEIWPSMTWKDITSAYAGLFFRAEGGKSKKFGEIQEDYSPRLIDVNFLGNKDCSSEASEPNIKHFCGITGAWNTGNGYTSFHVSDGEVTPRNMAIRVWKRTG